MWKFFQGFLQLVGLALQGLAVLGGDPNLEQMLAEGPVLEYLQQPWTPSILAVLGALILAYSWSQLLLERRLRISGGITRREFPARLDAWDDVNNFPVWQVVWLWNGLEPQDQTANTEGTVAYPTFRRLKEDLARKAIPNAEKVGGSWRPTVLSRQELIDYAFNIGQRPKFLFRNMRHSFFIRSILGAFRNEVPFDEALKYNNLYELTHYLEQQIEMELEDRNTDENPDTQDRLSLLRRRIDYEEYRERIRRVEEIMRAWFWQGHYEAIGRKKVNGLFYHYERIPNYKWEWTEWSVNTVRWADQEYGFVRCRFVE